MREERRFAAQGSTYHVGGKSGRADVVGNQRAVLQLEQVCNMPQSHRYAEALRLIVRNHDAFHPTARNLVVGVARNMVSVCVLCAVSRDSFGSRVFLHRGASRDEYCGGLIGADVAVLDE